MRIGLILVQFSSAQCVVTFVQLAWISSAGNGGVARLISTRAHIVIDHRAQLVDEYVELISSLLFRQISRFAANRSLNCLISVMFDVSM